MLWTQDHTSPQSPLAATVAVTAGPGRRGPVEPTTRRLPAHGEFEGVAVQRLGAGGGDADGAAELEAGAVVEGDRVRLDDHHLVLLERPRLQGVGGGADAELRVSATLPVDHAVEDGEAARGDHLAARKWSPAWPPSGRNASWTAATRSCSVRPGRMRASSSSQARSVSSALRRSQASSSSLRTQRIWSSGRPRSLNPVSGSRRRSSSNWPWGMEVASPTTPTAARSSPRRCSSAATAPGAD